MKKVVLDIFGADRGPEVIIEGGLDALKIYSDICVVFVGDADIVSDLLKKYEYDQTRVEIIDAKEQITNDESPTVAIRAKKESSLVKAFEEVKSNPEVIGMVSTGSTGAVLTGGIFKIGRIKGVFRPALCPLLPTSTGGKVCVIDCGANMDCKPEYLAQFAIMGSEYMKSEGVENPRVALVSVGVEDKKGNDLTHATFNLLKKLPINFVGNMEARDALSGQFDVLVCDGFVGNVLIKSVEGTAKMVSGLLVKEIKSSLSAKIGYALFMRKTFERFKASMDYHAVGGSAFLGIEKVLVKSHGSSKAKTITASIGQIVRMSKLDSIERIKKAIAEIDVRALMSNENND